MTPPNEAPTASGEVGELVEPVATQYRYRHKNPSAIWSAWGEHNAALALCLDYECERRELVPASALTAANADRDRLARDLEAELNIKCQMAYEARDAEDTIARLARELEEAREATLTATADEIARAIEAHDDFDCPAGTTYVRAARAIADRLVERFGSVRSLTPTGGDDNGNG